MHQDQVTVLIQRERTRQIEAKGYSFQHDRLHGPLEWVAVLQHELGQLADVALHNYGPADAMWLEGLTKVAAVAAAALEQC